MITEYGIGYRRVRYQHGIYWELAHSPLADATITDLDTFAWPDPDDPGRYEGLAEEVKDVYNSTPYALVGCSGFQTLWQVHYAFAAWNKPWWTWR